MKTTALADVAWVATISTFQDGDVFRETNIDTMADSIADRLGYLKARADAAVEVGDSPVTWTGTHIFSTNPVSVNAGFEANIGGINKISVDASGTYLTTGDLTVAAGLLSFGATSDAGVVYRAAAGSDATATITAASDRVVVPTLTANRVWTVKSTVPAPEVGRRIRISRGRTADAFTLELRREDATSLATISASAQGWVELEYSSDPKWVVIGWGGTVTGINTDAA